MLARRNDDAELRASLDVDVRIDAALTDEPELVQSMEQRRADLGPLADQHQRFGIPQSFGQRIDILDVIVPDLDLVARQLFEAVERPKRVVIIVKNGDLHKDKLMRGRAFPIIHHFLPPRYSLLDPRLTIAYINKEQRRADIHLMSPN